MKKFLTLIIAAACMLTLCACGDSAASGGGKLLAAGPDYPQMVPYPDRTKYFNSSGEFDDDGFYEAYDAWCDSRSAQRNQPEDYAAALEDYLRRSVPQLLSGEAGQNRICSPVNVYMALAMLAEATGGESRQQLLELLGSDSLEALRAEAQAVWNANYCDDGTVASLLASSLWLSDSVKYVPETVDILAKNYYASSFSGTMGSEELNQALQDWVNGQTGGLLSKQVSGLKTDDDTVLALISTIYFCADWDGKFSEANTFPQTFHAPGGDTSHDFMHSRCTGIYYWGDKFAACAKSLKYSGSMWFLLPDEGVSPEDLVAGGQALDFLLSGGEGAENGFFIVNLAVPKFDVSSNLELSDSLDALGVTDVFDPTVSDFSPLTGDAGGIFLSRAEHAARVAIDEHGVTAAAYTMMDSPTSGIPPEDEVDFILDRPFIFAVTSHDGLPLFVGIVNNP